MGLSKPWLLALLLPLLQGAQAQPSCRTKTDCNEGQFCRFPDGECVAPGLCEEIPLFCTMEYQPVCGCDGKTYGNRCGAFGAGVSVRIDDECPPSSSSSSSSSSLPPPTEPTSGQKEEETGRQGGQHQHKRDLLDVDEWVSGAETLMLRVEKASRNGHQDKAPEGAAAAAVAAAGAGIISSQEPQRLPARSCGSRGLPACLEGEWCDYVDGTCGETDKGGVCRELQLACTRIYMPVCGCDGATHSNACVARSKQISVRHEGPCSSSPSSSEGMDLGAGASATAPAAAAVESAATEKQREEETKTIPFPPLPLSASVSPRDAPSSQNPSIPPASYPSLRDVWQALGGRGQSSEKGSPCGGMMGMSCPTDQVCIFPRGTCGAADEMGTCLSPPFICALIYQPVCGCNGRTFSNECYAHAAAVSVAAQGPCLPPIPDTDGDAPAPATAVAATAPAAPAAAAGGMLQHNGVGTTNAETTAAATAPPAAAGPAAAQKNVEEEYLLRGHDQGGGRRV